MNYVTNTFLLVSSSVRSKQLLCFEHSQGQKKWTKTYNKELCRVSSSFPSVNYDLTEHEKSLMEYWIDYIFEPWWDYVNDHQTYTNLPENESWAGFKRTTYATPLLYPTDWASAINLSQLGPGQIVNCIDYRTWRRKRVRPWMLINLNCGELNKRHESGHRS